MSTFLYREMRTILRNGYVCLVMLLARAFVLFVRLVLGVRVMRVARQGVCRRLRLRGEPVRFRFPQGVQVKLYVPGSVKGL